LADTDFLTLKGIFESFLVNLGILSTCEWITFSEPRLFKDERAARICMDGMTVGYFGEASQELGFKTLSCLLEVDLDVLIEKSNFIKKYQNLPQYPTVFRDLAVIVNEETPWSSIEKCITDTKIAFLKEVNFFDVYRGKQIPSGKKSIAFNLCFQSPDRTLRSEEVDIELQAIVDSLQRILNVELRKT
jgi:phenylalanyl-tRNA synthetase beta chain